MSSWSWSSIAGAVVGLSIANWLLAHPHVNVHSSKSPEEEMKFGTDMKIGVSVVAAVAAVLLVHFLVR